MSLVVEFLVLKTLMLGVNGMEGGEHYLVKGSRGLAGSAPRLEMRC